MKKAPQFAEFFFVSIFIDRNIAIDMGASKTENYTKETLRMSEVAKALAHPARLKIIQYLVSLKTCVCGELVDEIGLAQSTISQHLKELKEVGLIKGNIDGTSVCYCLDLPAWDEASRMFYKLFQEVETSISCC